MKPASGKDEMVNASAINDGAAVLAESAPVQALGLKPLARLVGYAHAGVEPAYMGIGPGAGDAQGAAARRPEGRRHLDVIESNKTFAAQACAVIQELDHDPAK